MMDKIIVNLTSILLSGTGFFVVFTKFNVPELRSSFYGQNPFMIKADQIDNVTTWIFTGLAIIGLLIQVLKEIFGMSIPDRIHTVRYYIFFFIIGVFAMVWLTWGFSSVSKLIARQIWLPKIINSHSESFSKALFIVEHDGWREDQIRNKDTLKDSERYKNANYESVERSLKQIERLLDLPKNEDDFSKRIEKLKHYFKSNQ